MEMFNFSLVGHEVGRIGEIFWTGFRSTKHKLKRGKKTSTQLQEIEIFKIKIDELISEGYHSKLDDGVEKKNSAHLQKKDLLRAEVLKATERKNHNKRSS